MPSKVYEAPLRYVNDAKREVIPGEFLAYLNPGHSMTDHSAAVGTRMEAYMRADPDIKPEERTAYSCKGINDDLLKRVISDPGVELEDCNFKPIAEPDAAANPSATFQVLLRSNDEHGDVVPGEYLVSLHPGHTVEEHSAVVGTNMHHYIRWTSDKFGEDHVLYSCLDVGDELLKRIRSDEGVESVDCNFGPFITLD